MLFFIDDSVATFLQNNSEIETHDTLCAVEGIAHGRRMGKHLVFAGRTTLDYLRSCQSISAPARNVYAKLYQRIAQDKSYFDNLFIHVRLLPNGDTLEVTEKDGKQIIIASAKHFVDLELFSETVLLSENQGDIKLYSRLAKAYLHWSSIGRVDLQHESRGGGGHTIADEYLAIQGRRKRLCLCILDSDIEVPGLSPGDTAKKILKIDDPMQPLCKVFVINNCREIENFIPSLIYKEVVRDDVNWSNAWAAIEQLERLQHPHAIARHYIDMKEGLRLHDLLSKSDESFFYVFWSRILSEMGTPISCSSEDRCEKRSKCQCIIIPGMGTSILKAVNTFLETKTDAQVAEMVDSAFRKMWKDLCERIVSWCCAGNQMSGT